MYMPLPVAIRVSQQCDESLAVHDMFGTSEEVVDVLPINNSLAINIIAWDLFDSGGSR